VKCKKKLKILNLVCLYNTLAVQLVNGKGVALSLCRVPIVQTCPHTAGVLRVPQHLLPACESKRGPGWHGESHTHDTAEYLARCRRQLR